MASVKSLSFGTRTSTVLTSTASRADIAKKKLITMRYKGAFLWQGRYKRITSAIVRSPWNMVWQTIVMLEIVYCFIMTLLLMFYCTDTEIWWILIALTVVGDGIFFCDSFVHLLHLYWPLVKLNVRAYRRNVFLVAFDLISSFPFTLFHVFENGMEFVHIGRCISIIRIYRFFGYCDFMSSLILHQSRKLWYTIQHVVMTLLILHAFSCFWYGSHKAAEKKLIRPDMVYPPHVTADKLKFDSYLACWYYCSCRLFNVIFGDSFPSNPLDTWLTSCLMLIGYVFIRYHFIGRVAWSLANKNARQLKFIDRYHHMISYLNFHGAPSWLIEQAKNYKLRLWKMKDGVLTSNHLQKLPLALQMELIFDINVGHFHNTLLFRDTDESFMRQIALLMRHEIFLEGQQIWCQDVVKNGMICIKHGVIEMLSDEDDESPMIAFTKGTVLGELSLFYSIPSKVTVKAATYVELQLLKRTDLMRLLNDNPYVLHNVRKKIEERLNKTMKRQRAIDEYDKGDSRLIRTRYRPMKVLKDYLAGREDEDSSFSDDSHLYYRDENNVRLPKFTDEYLELYKLSDNVTTIDKPHICIRSKFPWILEPDTDFTIMFDIVHFVLVMYVCLVIPYVAILASIYSNAQAVLNTVVKGGLMLHIYLQLTTAIVHKNTRKETIKEIADEKMASFGFYLDILSVFPMYIFTDTLDPENSSCAGQIALLLPIVQFWHIWEYTNKWEKSFYCNPKIICLFKYSTLIIILTYWAGCFMYLYACPRKLCREFSWMEQLTYWETKILITNSAKHEKPHASSLAFGSAIVTGTGSAELAPGVGDLFLVTILFKIGAYISCFYIAKVCSVYMLSTQRKLKFKESMRELFYFLSVNHVSSKIKARVRKFFCVQWYYNNAVSSRELFKNMSTNIQQEVLAIEMVDSLMCCPLFQECSRDFLQTVASNTRIIVLPDNEIVQHAADISRDMFILQKGHCHLLSYMGKVVAHVGPGDHFGVVEMLYGLPKVYTVVTTTNCILLHVEYTALVQCLSTFPDVMHPISVALEDDQVLSLTKRFEDAKQLVGRLDAKINRIAQEIKESFVILTDREERVQYMRTYEKLGVMRHIRFLILPGTITPHGIFLKLWCALRFVMAIYYILIVPYNIASKQHLYSKGMDYVDIILYLDVVVMSYVAYYNRNNLLVTHPLLTISHYLRHAFLLDFIIVFPFELAFRLINANANLDVYRLNKLLQVTRITGAFYYWETDIMRVNQAVVLFKFLPVAITIVNFATSFIFMETCRPFMKRGDYFISANCTRTLVINDKNYEIEIAYEKYLTTFFWVFEMFVGCACTAEATASNADFWMLTALQIVGCLYFAFMFGYVSSTRSAAAYALLDHTEKTNDLANFLYQESVEPMLTAKTLKYFEYVWKRTNGSNPQQICRRLNSALMEDTLVFMYEKTLREVPLFGNVDRSFIRVITQHLTEMYFLKGETVIQCRDIQPNIYIIYRGKVDVLSSYNEMITCMGPGGMFGNFIGQPIACSDVSIFASRSLDLLVIPSQTFFNMVRYYPKIQEPLTKAFEMSKDYILPITMDITSDDVTPDQSDDEDKEYSADSTVDSRSDNFDFYGKVSVRSSQSTLSHSKSGISVTTFQSGYSSFSLFKPSTSAYHQVFGYLVCCVLTANYILVLYNLVTLNDCYILYWIHTIFDVFYYIKTYINVHQGYLNSHSEMIMDPVKCRRKYFRRKNTFYSDLFVILPLELFGFCFRESTHLQAMHYLRVNKLFRVKYLWEFYRKTSSELTNNITTLQTAMTIFVVILLLHTFTCIWLVLLSYTMPVCIIRTLKLHLFNEQAFLSGHRKRWDYTTSFYIMTAEMTATGGDEITLDNVLAIAVLAVGIVAGKMLAAIVVATSMQVAYSSNHALTVYERSILGLIDVLKNQGLSKYQLKKFWAYVRELWVSERGRQLPALLAQTPYVRRCDLMSAMFGHHLRNSFVFGDTGEAFLRQLTVVLDYTIFFPGNYIVVAGDIDARMYWVNSGTVAVVSVRSDLTETTHEYLGSGDIFGIMQGLNRGIKHCFSYRAETKVTILSLALDSWIHILPFFPEAQTAINEKAEIMFARI